MSSPTDLAVSAALEGSSTARRRSTRARQKEQAVSKKAYAFDEVELFLQKNEFIRGHYRGSDLTLREVFLSLFRVHNESGNIYSHFLGCLLFIGLTIWLAKSPPTPVAYGAHKLWDTTLGEGGVLSYTLHAGHEMLDRLLPHRAHALQAHNAALDERWLRVHEPLVGSLLWPAPRWPIFCFTVGAALCLALSTTCHLFYCCTPRLNGWIWRLDYVGISGLIVTSFYPQIAYAFMCSPKWLWFYLTVTTALGSAAMAVSLLPRFQVPAFRRVRALVFAGLGLWGIVPMTHMWLSYAHIHSLRQALCLDILMGAIYLSGAAIYAMRLPERWSPGTFDIVFSSHQIFHLCVVAAACVHFKAVMLLLEWRDASGGCAAPLLGARPR